MKNQNKVGTANGGQNGKIKLEGRIDDKSWPLCKDALALEVKAKH